MISYVQKLSLLGLQMLINREVLVGCGACERRVAGDGWVCVRVERREVWECAMDGARAPELRVLGWFDDLGRQSHKRLLILLT